MLDLKRLKTTTPTRQLDEEDRIAKSGPAKGAAKPDGWYGRKSAPPAPGSEYGEFLEWATEGGPEWPGAVNLAVKLWMGMAPSQEPEGGTAPRP